MARLRSQDVLKIGIVGFGNFGQFLAKRMVQQGHQVGFPGMLSKRWLKCTQCLHKALHTASLQCTW